MSRRVPISLLLVTLAAGAVAPAPAFAQHARFDFFARGPYRADVPRPDDILGYAAGEHQTQYTEQQEVFDRLLAVSGGRAVAESIGVTEEGRVMRAILISSPANIARRDTIRRDLARLADPAHTSPDSAAAIAARTPVVVMLAYTVHGDEPAGFEASMWVAYQLIASNEPATKDILDHDLVILIPSENPDGHERFAVWYNSLAVGTDEPAAYETREPWGIVGRYSHYRFDMNRDLIAQSQAPVRAILGTIRRWHPQVYADHHSTTEQFYFPPFAEPVNANVPAASKHWIEIFGEGNAAAFDAHGWQYYTRDIFDGYYVGYFDVGPTLDGATGMTYESDGGPEYRIRHDDGTVITFADGIAHHYVASLATLGTAAQHATARLADYAEFFRTAVTDGRAATMKRIVILPDRDPTEAARLEASLLGHDVAVVRLTKPYTATAAHDYYTGDARGTRRTFPAGAIVVDLAQPHGRMARALLEPDPAEPRAFAERELAKYRRNQRRSGEGSEGYDFYDVTAWSLPYTFGLDAAWTEDLTPVTGDTLVLTDPAHPARALEPAGSVSGHARSAYVFPNDREGAARLAVGLLNGGFAVDVSTEPLRADGTSYPRGTFVVRTVRNPDSLDQRIATLAKECGVGVTAIQSAFPDSGWVGIGSESVEALHAPHVLVAAGPGISQTSYGALWYFLDRELHAPFVPVALGRIGGMRTMSDYNVFVISDGSPDRIADELGKEGIARLKAWVKDGGTVIAYGRAALFLARSDVELTTVRALGDTTHGGDSLPSGPDRSPPIASPAADTNAVVSLPGAIFRATLDTTSWLTMGYTGTTLAVPVSGDAFLAPSKHGENAVVFVGDSLRLSGWQWPGNTERLLRGSVWAVAESSGRGTAVVFANDPLFRAFWRGTARLLTNAMLMGGR